MKLNIVTKFKIYINKGWVKYIITVIKCTKNKLEMMV